MCKNVTIVVLFHMEISALLVCTSADKLARIMVEEYELHQVVGFLGKLVMMCLKIVSQT